MAILKPAYTIFPTPAITGLSTLGVGGGVLQDVASNNVIDQIDIMEITVNLASVVSNTGFISVYIVSNSLSGQQFAAAQVGNLRRLGSVELSGSGLVTKTFSIPLTSIGPHYKLYFLNNSTGALTFARIDMMAINYTDV